MPKKGLAAPDDSFDSPWPKNLSLSVDRRAEPKEPLAVVRKLVASAYLVAVVVPEQPLDRPVGLRHSPAWSIPTFHELGHSWMQNLSPWRVAAVVAVVEVGGTMMMAVPQPEVALTKGQELPAPEASYPSMAAVAVWEDYHFLLAVAIVSASSPATFLLYRVICSVGLLLQTNS